MQILGGVSRNAVIGKAHRLNLSSKIKTRSTIHSQKNQTADIENNQVKIRGKRGKFKSLLLDQNFEPAKNLTLEELTDETCKYMEKNPNEKDARFCGRKNVEKFSYCPLHLMIVFQPKGKKDDTIEKDEDIPKYIEKNKVSLT